MARTKSFDPDDALDRAMRLFWANGYEATSIDDLVAATGVNRASLYGTFGDKHALFLKSLERYTGIGLFASLDLSDDSRPARQVLGELFDRLIARCLDGHGAGCLITNTVCEFGGRDPTVLEGAQTALARMENALDLIVRRGQAAGEIDPTVPARDLARFLLTAMQGLQVMARVHPDARSLEAVARRTLDALPAGPEALTKA